MKPILRTMRIASFAALFIMLFACSSTDRSRALDNSDIPAQTIAMQVCSNCHGLHGISTSPNFPNLAAQPAEYLAKQLKSFKSHGRSDPAGFEYMWGLSARLTDQQIEGLAAYFSSQPGANGSGAVISEAGKSIFEQGIPAQNIPACAACHGTKGEGVQLFPRLAGQHKDYILKQLVVFQRTEERPDGAMMKAITHDLSAENMQNVASYIANFSSQ